MIRPVGSPGYAAPEVIAVKPQRYNEKAGWVGLGWVGLGWVGLGWVGLGWVGLGWVGLGWVGWLVGWLLLLLLLLFFLGGEVVAMSYLWVGPISCLRGGWNQ